MSTRAAALNRAFNNTDATVAAFTATVADLNANEIAAANKFDVPTLTDAALAKQVMTNMGFLPSTVAAITQLEIELAAYFGGMGKGNRGFVVLQLSNILSGIAATDATYGAIATAWNAEVAASVASSSNQTITLTTSADTATGGEGTDSFIAALSSLSTANTLGATDVVVGGAANDTMSISVDAAFTGFTTGSVTGVETISLTNTGATIRAVDVKGITGATTYSVDGTTAAVNVSNMGTGVANLNLTGQKSGSFTTSFVSGSAEIAGTSNAVALGLNTVGATSSVTVTPGSFETVNITSTGANSVSFDGSTIKTLTVAGSGALTVVAGTTALTGFNASAATGAITANVTSAAALALTTLSTGSGSDKITFDESDAAANLTISAGAGTDELIVTSNGGTLEYTMTGVETLNIDALTTAALTFSGRKTTDLTTITTDADAVQTVTLVNMGSGAYTFNANGATANEGGVSSDHTGATTVNYTAATTSQTAKTAQATLADYTFAAAAGALTVNVGAYVNATGSVISADKASSVTLNTTSGGSNAETPVEQTTFGSVLSAVAATSVTVDSKGILAAGSGISATAAKTASITIGAAAGDLDLTAAALTSLTTVAGAALDLTGSTLTKLETLNSTASIGHTQLPALPAATSITLAGTGTSTTLGRSQATIASIGSSTKDSDVTVNASGLRGGLSIGAIQTNAGYDVTTNLSGVTGNVSLTSIGTGTGGDDVYVTAEKIGGTLTVGAIVATGDVIVKTAGTAGAVSLSTISGEAITVDVADNIAGTTYGTITAKNSATLSLSDLQANTVRIDAKAASTALTVAVTGGIALDAITINGVSTNTSITVTGDLGVGSDTVVVNGYDSTKTQAINVSGLVSYTTGTLTGGSGSDTITGGAGADTIIGARGQDTLTGGAGSDVFVFNAGDSALLTPDTITDLKSADAVQFGNVAIASVGTAGTASATTATTTAFGDFAVASFGASVADTLTAKVTALDLVTADVAGRSALFTFNNTTYLFIDSGSTDANDVVVILTGVTIPTSAVTDGTGTGLSGFGA